MYLPSQLPTDQCIQEAFAACGFRCLPVQEGAAIMGGRGPSFLEYSFIRKLRKEQRDNYPRLHVYIFRIDIRQFDGREFGHLVLEGHIDKSRHSMDRGPRKKRVKSELRHLSRNLEQYSLTGACPD